MKRSCGPLVMAGVAMLMVLGVASEPPPKSYREAMSDVEAASSILVHHARMIEREGDCCYEPIAKDGIVLQHAFETVLAFWTERHVDDAVQLARDAVHDATELASAAQAKHYDRVVAAEGAILSSCQPCHARHRVALPNGSFDIK